MFGKVDLNLNANYIQPYIQTSKSLITERDRTKHKKGKIQESLAELQSRKKVTLHFLGKGLLPTPARPHLQS